MEQRAFPWRAVLLGCGGVMALGFLVLGALIALGVGWLGLHMSFSKATVERMAGEILPGVTAPPGYDWAFGTEAFGERTVEFGSTGRSGDLDLAIGLVQLARSDRRFGMDQAPEALARINELTGPVVETTSRPVKVGGVEFPGVRQEYQPEDGAPRRVRILAGLGDPEHRPVLVYLDGPANDLDLLTFQEFCAKARVDGFRPLQAASSGDGAESEPLTPEAPLTPEEPLAPEAPPEPTGASGPP